MTNRERFDEAASRARDAAGQARVRSREAVERSREAAVQTREAMGDALSEGMRRVKPRLRGVSHQWGFFAALAAGAILVALAPEGRATLAAAIYAFSLVALLGTSALYHRINWRRPSARMWMRRLDHSMIFVLIAGTITPFCLLVLEGPLATALLIAVWAAAIAGTIVETIWVDAPKWVSVAVYVGVGWLGLIGFPSIVIEAGLGAGALIAIGGALYTIGAVVYARQSPDPSPATFGYHEIFHVLVLAAATSHFAAIAIYAIPQG